jgi:RNA polymerase sigma-70 factor (ECF subfamily)
MDATVEDLEGFRPLMFSIAYRMIGEVGDAEDIVQEAFLRAHRTLIDGTEIRQPKAFLSEVTTRLAIDHLRSARVRREQYVGTWLPEPILTEPDAGERTEELESLSMAFLVVLERLAPVERAVFLLHDVFGFGFDEVAPIVDKTADNCRQIAVRARSRVEADRPRFEASLDRRNELAERFFAALQGGDLDGLLDLLTEDVVMVGDGGGQGAALREPARGRMRVARFLLGIVRRFGPSIGSTIAVAEVNGQPGGVAYLADGTVATVFVLDVVDDRIATIRSIANPDKLLRVPPRPSAGAPESDKP